MRRSPWLLLALLASCAQLLAFAALDRRPPDDHDDFYTADCLPWIAALRSAAPVDRPGLLWDQVAAGELHPRLAQTALVATLAAVGPGRIAYRLVNLPFLLLMVLGTWALAREIGVRRPGLAAFAVAAAPIVVNASRKWDIQFHAASLTPLGLWFLVAALRRGGRAGLPWWLALGLWQALRLYSHPIVATDVLLTLVAALVLLPITAPSAGVLRGARLGAWAAAASITGWLGLWYSGLAPRLVGAPPHNFLGYLQLRENYASGWWMAEASPSAWAGLALRMLAETSWVHLFPLGFALLTAGLLCALWALRREGVGGATLLALLPAVLAAAQLLPAVLAVSNRAFLNDWLFVVPGLVVTALWGAERVLAGRTARAAAAGLVLQSAFVLLVPWAARAVGPEPVEQPGWYDRGPLKLFTRSSSGRHLVTHHLPSRFLQPGQRLGERLAAAEAPEGLARYDLFDLRWDPARGGGPGCRLGSAGDREAWAWGWPPGLAAVASREPSGWPLAFVGFDGASPGWPDRRPPEREARFAVVRLWVTPSDRWDAEALACRPEARLPEGWMDAAAAIADERLGAAPLETLADPGGWLVGRVIEWDRTRAYVGAGLLIDRGTGQVQVQPKLDLFGDVGAAESPGERRTDPDPAPP